MTAITLWKGKPLEECDRDELLEVIGYLGEIHKEHFRPENIRARAREAAAFAWSNGNETYHFPADWMASTAAKRSISSDALSAEMKLKFDTIERAKRLAYYKKSWWRRLLRL